LDELTILSDPSVAVLTAQLVVAPSPVGCEARVALALAKPLGLTQPPDDVVQNLTSTDLTAVLDSSAAVDNVYVTPLASPTGLDRATDRPEIEAAFTGAMFITGKALITTASTIVRIISRLFFIIPF
jgi:hypothetical protein